jgi:hypothetical protein
LSIESLSILKQGYLHSHLKLFFACTGALEGVSYEISRGCFEKKDDE